MPNVIFDPGHGGLVNRGGSTPFGVRGPRGTLEKDVTLALCEILKARFAANAGMTRHDDVNPSLEQRARAASQAGASVFLSLHANGGRRGTRGSEVWVHSKSNARSRAFARSLCRALGSLAPDRGVKAADLSVLDPAWHAREIAACLVEVDFLSDPDGEARLRDPAALRAIADAISRVVEEQLRCPGTQAFGSPARARGRAVPLSGPGPTCPPFLPAVTDTDYFRYIQAPTLGRALPLINGRSSGGTGPDDDHTEALDAMETTVKGLGAGDFVYLSAWFFEPATPLTAGGYMGLTTWGQLFAKKASEGVKVRILINDFDPISHLDQWLLNSCLTPLDAIVNAMAASDQDNLKYVVSRHPAHIGALKSLLAGQGGRSIYVASHHQKFMVARRGDEMTAFCGGLDIESRKTPARWSYAGLAGWHDIHVRLEGPITRDLEKEFVMRWNRESGSSTRRALAGWSGYDTLAGTPLSATDDTPDKKVHQLQMLRTVSKDATFSPYSTERDDIKEVYRRGIGCATQFIYMENQYFRSTELADWIVARGKAQPSLVVIIVVVASAGADDGANEITEHGDHLQYATFDRIVSGLGASRVRIYTMKSRAVHSKFILTDDAWMMIGSANANVRSFELDSELNVQIPEPDLVSAFRARLWAHNLGTSEATVRSWAAGDFMAQWDAVATANAALSDPDMAGEGVLVYDYTQVQGEAHGSIPDAVAELDVAPEGRMFAGADTPAAEGGDSEEVGIAASLRRRYAS